MKHINLHTKYIFRVLLTHFDIIILIVRVGYPPIDQTTNHSHSDRSSHVIVTVLHRHSRLNLIIRVGLSLRSNMLHG